MIKVFVESEEKIKIAIETLSRVGDELPWDKEKRKPHLKQLCFLIKEKGDFYLVYYKELMKEEMLDEDYSKLNTVGTLLENWEILKMDPDTDLITHGTVTQLKVISNKEKKDWILTKPIDTKLLKKIK